MHCTALEHRQHCIRHALYFFFYDCFVFIPLSFSADPVAAGDYTAAEYDYFVDDPAPSVELPGKQIHSLPQISPTFPYFLALGIVTTAATIIVLFNCIACFCRPLMYLPLSYAAYY